MKKISLPVVSVESGCAGCPLARRAGGTRSMPATTGRTTRRPRLCLPQRRLQGRTSPTPAVANAGAEARARLNALATAGLKARSGAKAKAYVKARARARK
jgi:hypothetical protein